MKFQFWLNVLVCKKISWGSFLKIMMIRGKGVGEVGENERESIQHSRTANNLVVRTFSQDVGDQCSSPFVSFQCSRINIFLKGLSFVPHWNENKYQNPNFSWNRIVVFWPVLHLIFQLDTSAKINLVIMSDIQNPMSLLNWCT